MRYRLMNNINDKDKEYYFGQYKLYIEGIEKISDRRENANKYLLSLNSAIVAGVGFLINSNIKGSDLSISLAGILILGLAISVIFWFLINSYKQLNTGKLAILHKIEKKLPIQMYEEEWILLGEGKDRSKYYPFSHIEKLIPFLFGFVYLLGIIYVLFFMFLCIKN